MNEVRPPLRGSAPSHVTNPGIAPLAAPAVAAPVAPPPAPGNATLTRRCATCNERYPADFLICPRDATALTDEAGGEQVDPLVGKLLGETYQIVRVVGEGGMGRVYEARHLRLKERRFAVKTLHADLARNNEMAARFRREAESASSISHSNVVDVFDVHHLPDGTPYLVGEFLEGEELADYVKDGGALKPRLAADVARQVTSALAAAHARDIVHRDMKPENIFVLKSSIDALAGGALSTLSVKVLDFGISKSGGVERTHLTRTGVIMGTPSYMSPEQARGKQVDHRADIYSLGACLYFMLTGKRPFDSDDPTATISMVLTEDPKRPREIETRIPETLELIVQRAMAKDARDRYQTMGEFERALSGFLTAGRPPSFADQRVASIHDIRETGTERAFNLAKAMLAGEAEPPPETSPNVARAARPTVVLASAALFFWLLGGTVAALAGLVRVLHDGEITLTESLLLVVGCVFAALTPIVLYAAHVRRVIWPNSVRSLVLASDLKRMTSVTLVTYGTISIVGRFAQTVLLRSSGKLASGYWDIGLFLVSLVAAMTLGRFGTLLRNMRRRRLD
jgi:serine/threonine protein kinase